MERGCFGFPGSPSTANLGWITDTDVQAYWSSVNAAGGSISAATLQSVQKLVVGLKADGVWSSLSLIWPCCGDQLAAALVCFKNSGSAALLTNNNFVAGDYVERGSSGGLLGNGTTKYLDTGVSIPGLTQNSVSIGAYCTSMGNTGGMIGSSYSATGNTDRFYVLDADPLGASQPNEIGLGSLFPINISGLGLTFFTQRDTSGTGVRAWLNLTSQYSASGNQTWQKTGTVNIFRATGLLTNGRLSFAFIGSGLTDTQARLLAGRVQAFQQDFGRSY